MKKLLAILVMLLYIVPAIGVNVSSHFCGREAVSSCFKEQKSCVCTPKAMKKGCCENKQQLLKIDDTQQKAELPVQKFSNPFYAILSIPTELTSIVFTDYTNAIGKCPAKPPYLYREPIYLLNRVFRI